MLILFCNTSNVCTPFFISYIFYIEVLRCYKNTLTSMFSTVKGVTLQVLQGVTRVTNFRVKFEPCSS